MNLSICCEQSESLSLVKFPPEVATDCHHADHAHVDQRENQALVQLLVHDIIKDIVHFSEIYSLFDIFQLFLTICCLDRNARNLIVGDLIDHTLFVLDKLIECNHLFDKNVQTCNLLLELLEGIYQLHRLFVINIDWLDSSLAIFSSSTCSVIKLLQHKTFDTYDQNM